MNLTLEIRFFIHIKSSVIDNYDSSLMIMKTILISTRYNYLCYTLNKLNKISTQVSKSIVTFLQYRKTSYKLSKINNRFTL